MINQFWAAIGIAAARAHPPAHGIPTVAMATAHPAKFPESVARATGATPPLPPRLKGLYEGVERVTVLPHDGARVRAFIEAGLARS